jgi:hypothetical protein
METELLDRFFGGTSASHFSEKSKNPPGKPAGFKCFEMWAKVRASHVLGGVRLKLPHGSPMAPG